MRTWILVFAMASIGGCVEEGYTVYDPHGHPDEAAAHSHSPPSDEGVSTKDCEDAYPGADPRFHERVSAEEDSHRTIHVESRNGLISNPLSSATPIKVSAIFTITADAVIQLRDPGGRVVRSEEFSGHKELDEASWFSVDDAMTGDWSLRIVLKNHEGATPEGAYTFGFS